MSQKRLGLRNQGHQVSLIRLNGETRLLLGRKYPAETDLRRQSNAQWGDPTHTGRQTALDSIDEALPQRSQTILSYQLDPTLRASVNAGVGRLKLPAAQTESAEPRPPAQSRTEAEAAIQQTVKIGPIID